MHSRTIDKPKEIASEIAIYLRKRPHLSAIYIAAPLEEAKLIEAIKEQLSDEFPIFTGETLLKFMLDSYPECEWMKVLVYNSTHCIEIITSGKLPRHLQQPGAGDLRAVRHVSLRGRQQLESQHRHGATRAKYRNRKKRRKH